jgi:hypothetical protein
MERLKQLDQELHATILLQQKKKQEFSEHLAHTVFRIQQLASSRQIYQEVDLKDSALAATSKECDECKDREFRLRLSLESLKQAIPRFLTKITKVPHPKPSETQVMFLPVLFYRCCCWKNRSSLFLLSFFLFLQLFHACSLFAAGRRGVEAGR